MRTFTYTLVEYDPQKSWLVLSTRLGMTVELERAADFGEWSREAWPGERYRATLDPGQAERLM
jgi:hypothetical protein